MKQNLLWLGNVKDNIGTRDWRQVLGPIIFFKFGQFSNIEVYFFWNSDSIGEGSELCTIQTIPVEDNYVSTHEIVFQELSVTFISS